MCRLEGKSRRALHAFAGIVLLAAGATGAEPKWLKLRSANFEMYSSAGLKPAQQTIRQFEEVRSFFVRAMGSGKPDDAPVRIVLFNSPKEYEPYRLNEYATAYYHQAADRDYIVISHGGTDTFPTAVHEYVHLLTRHGGLTLPPWLNEGLADLYSTLRPMGDKILVGDLIPGRRRALLESKWVPLATILAADQDSPFYNERNKAGNLYNEGWALTHMLYFREEYRPKFPELVAALSTGTDAATAFRRVYGASIAQIEAALQDYLRGETFQGALFSVTIEKRTDAAASEALSAFDLKLMFADLLDRPGREAATRASLERLTVDDPQRYEPFAGLGYLAWRAGRLDDSLSNFGKAFDRGDRDPRMLWDYARMLERRDREKAATILGLLIAHSPDRVDARLELADIELRMGEAKAALDTLRPVRQVGAEDAARFFRIGVNASLQTGDLTTAQEIAERFQAAAKTPRDRAAANALVETVQRAKRR